MFPVPLGTVRLVDPCTVSVAVIDVVPCATGATTPELETVATLGSDEDHVTFDVISSVLPSL